MTTRTPPDEAPPRRRWDRHSFEKEITLRLSDNRRFTGETRNVSLNGVFFATGGEGQGVKEGEEGVLTVTSGKESVSFPCRVARVTLEGLALNILERAATFGMLLTQDIFQEIQSAHPQPPLKGRNRKRASEN